MITKIYVSHPYGGIKENIESVENIIKELVNKEGEKDDDCFIINRKCYISPIHTFSFLYESLSYIDGMECCLALLDNCDEILLCKGWENSRGCQIEYGYAKAKGIVIRYI